MKIIKGNLLTFFKEGRFDFIGHQTNMILQSENCGGIAKYIFNDYPFTANTNNLVVENKGIGENQFDFDSGLFSYNDVDNVINIYGQYYPGSPDSNGYFDGLDHRKEILGKIFANMGNDENLKGKSIGLPLIASGLAKGDYKLSDLDYFNLHIYPIIEKNLDMDVTIVQL